VNEAFTFSRHKLNLALRITLHI